MNTQQLEQRISYSIDAWQAWSDEHFSELQLAIIHFSKWALTAAIALTLFSAKHLGRAFAYWQDAAKREQLMSLIMGYVEQMKRYGLKAYSKVKQWIGFAVGYALQVYDR